MVNGKGAFSQMELKMENGLSGMKMASLNLREAMWKTRLTAFGKNGLIMDKC